MLNPNSNQTQIVIKIPLKKYHNDYFSKPENDLVEIVAKVRITEIKNYRNIVRIKNAAHPKRNPLVNFIVLSMARE